LAITAPFLLGTLVCDTKSVYAQEMQKEFKRYSEETMIIGIVSIVIGSITSTVGTIAIVDGATYRAPEPCDPPDWCFTEYGANVSKSEMKLGGVLLGVGVVALGVGIPLTIIGAKKVPIQKNALLTNDHVIIEPTNNGVRLRF
jgi:hypothetical protein